MQVRTDKVLTWQVAETVVQSGEIANDLVIGGHRVFCSSPNDGASVHTLRSVTTAWNRTLGASATSYL